MPKALYVDVIPPGGGKISVTHIFWGETAEECQENFDAHAAGCNFLTPAIEEGRTGEELETVTDEEWPEYDDPEAEETEPEK